MIPLTIGAEAFDEGAATTITRTAVKDTTIKKRTKKSITRHLEIFPDMYFPRESFTQRRKELNVTTINLIAFFASLSETAVI